MEPVWEALARYSGPRGRGAFLLRDTVVPDRFGVALTLNDIYTGHLTVADKFNAVELFEAIRLDIEGYSSWNRVLERLRHPGRNEDHQRWEGSAGEYAARFFEIGTWEWVQTLMQIRRQTDEGVPVPQLRSS